METESRLVVAGCGEDGEEGVTVNGRVSFGSDGNILHGGCTAVRILNSPNCAF